MESQPQVIVVDYRKGNLKSVERGLAAAGAAVEVTSDAEAIARAGAVVLPGVGAFADAAATMAELGQVDAVRAAVDAGAPFLGICLGMHLMFEAGEEHAPAGGPLPRGLGLIPGTVGALARTDEEGRPYKVPHVGWNSVHACGAPSPLLADVPDGEYFYFTHSFAAPDGPATIARAVHARPFPCAVQVPGRPVFGVQFHPEKSSDAGARLLRSFVRLATRAR